MKEDYLELKIAIIENLELLNEEIIYYSTNSSDEGFDLLIKKAIYYREMLKKIQKLLDED